MKRKILSSAFVVMLLINLFILGNLTADVRTEKLQKVCYSSDTDTVSSYPIAGVDEHTPSKSMYFSWINQGWEGTDESRALANYGFFKWLHDYYGMILDLYVFDSGNIDGSSIPFIVPEYIDETQRAYEYTLATTDTEREQNYARRQHFFNDSIFYCGAPMYRRKFPNGLISIADRFNSLGTRLGLWLGPDGFGTTPAEAKRRQEFIVDLTREANLGLLKFDNCCSELRTEKIGYFTDMMREVRKVSPDLIALNHRINLDSAGLKQMTTFLWEGAETYVDVHISAKTTAPHGRVGNMDRGFPPGLKRLTEDHGVCLSSCLDHWQDDLVLQAFARNLILAPEIYGNPWLLKDKELAEMARLFNLHRQYNDILTSGILLPEKIYGKDAISRGNSSTRLISLVNLSWLPQIRTISVDGSIGIDDEGEYEIRQFHPTEKIIGKVKYKGTIRVTVEPFRSCLVRVTPVAERGNGIDGIDYKVQRTMPDQTTIELLGQQGMTSKLSLVGYQGKKIRIDGTPLEATSTGTYKVAFEGKRQTLSPYRKLPAKFIKQPITVQAVQLYEATVFSADNNALEVRSLQRAGKSSTPQVEAARNAFFNQDLFVALGIWDKQLFDGNRQTTFNQSINRYDAVQKKLLSQNQNVALRLDLGKEATLDSLCLLDLPAGYIPEKIESSSNLLTWTPVSYQMTGNTITILPEYLTTRYIRITRAPYSISEIEGYYHGKQMDRSLWRANNLFEIWEQDNVKQLLKASVKLEQIAPNMAINIPLDGKHGIEGAYVAFVIDGRPIGAPQRITSYPANCWESGVVAHDSNYTYQLPIDNTFEGKILDIYVISHNNGFTDFTPSVWLTSESPYISRIVTIE